MSDIPRTFPELPADAVAALKQKAAPASLHKLTTDFGFVYAKVPDAFTWKTVQAAGSEGDDVLLTNCVLAPSPTELRALAVERELPGALQRVAVEISSLALGSVKVRSEKL